MEAVNSGFNLSQTYSSLQRHSAVRQPPWGLPMTTRVEVGRHVLYCGDALEVLPTLEAGSIDAVVTDPPFFGVSREEWDNQWDSEASFLAWLASVSDHWCRLMCQNGSLYVFASPQLAAKTELLIAERFAVLNSVTWQKDFPCGALKYGAENFRSFVSMSERIIFAEHRNAFGAVLRAARVAAGLSAKALCERIGAHGEVNHGGAVCNWERGLNLPSKEHWVAMSSLLRLPSYEDAVRPFFATKDTPHTDTWTFKPVRQADLLHPCEKPLPLLRHILAASTLAGAVILDCFIGSGTTAVACEHTGRKCIGIEKDPAYFEIACRRLEAAVNSTPLFPEPPAVAAQPNLFEETT